MTFEKVEEGSLKSPRCKKCKKAVEIVRGKHYVIKKGVKILHKKTKCYFCGCSQYTPYIFKRDIEAENVRFIVSAFGLKRNLEKFI